MTVVDSRELSLLIKHRAVDSQREPRVVIVVFTLVLRGPCVTLALATFDIGVAVTLGLVTHTHSCVFYLVQHRCAAVVLVLPSVYPDTV